MSKRKARRLPARWVIEWDETNREHFRDRDRRACTERRVEEIVNHVCHSWRRTRLHSRPPPERSELTPDARYVMEEIARWLYVGESCDERLLGIVAAQVPRKVPTLRPITCWTLDWKAIQTYIAWRSTRKLG